MMQETLDEEDEGETAEGNKLLGLFGWMIQRSSSFTCETVLGRILSELHGENIHWMYFSYRNCRASLVGQIL